MTLRPQALRGAGVGTLVAGQVDYRLARNSVVSEFHKGRLSRFDICDAHPELLRAAANVGDETREECPICEEARVRLVSYVFGDRLPPSGCLRDFEAGDGPLGAHRQADDVLRGRGLPELLVEPPRPKLRHHRATLTVRSQHSTVATCHRDPDPTPIGPGRTAVAPRPTARVPPRTAARAGRRPAVASAAMAVHGRRSSSPRPLRWVSTSCLASPSRRPSPLQQTTFVYDSKGNVLASFSEQNRVAVSLDAGPAGPYRRGGLHRGPALLHRGGPQPGQHGEGCDIRSLRLRAASRAPPRSHSST